MLVVPALITLVPLLGGVRSIQGGTVAVLVIGYVITGFMEEMLWRGAVQRILAPTGTAKAVWLGSVLFGAAHLTNVLFRDSVALVLAQAFGAFCFGVGYAALRWRTNTIWPLMVLHLATDLFAAIGGLPKIPVLVGQDVVLLALGAYLIRGGACHSEGVNDETVRVFLVDDHKVVRSGLAAYLATEPGMAVVGEAGDGRRALDELAVLDRAGQLPDVVLMDLQMPAMDGVTATAEIKRRWPDVEVVAVTSFVEEARIRAALEAGATGYLLKDADAGDVAAAIRDGAGRRGAPRPGRREGPDRRSAGAAERRRQPDPARARGPRPARDRRHQPRDRQAPRRRRADRAHPRVEHPRQARAGQPHAGGDVGGQGGTRAAADGRPVSEPGSCGRCRRTSPGGWTALRSTSMPLEIRRRSGPARPTPVSTRNCSRCSSTASRWGSPVFDTEMRLIRCNKTWVGFYEHYFGVGP